MSNIAFIVEGQQEKKIIEQICNFDCVIRSIPNGHKMPIKKMAEVIYGHCRSFGNRHYPVVVIFDREDEKRSNSVFDMTSKIQYELELIQPKITSTMIFGVPDLTLESWILPFVGKNGIFTKTPVGGFEGKRCLGKLEKRLSDGGITYDKTGNGVSIFVNKVLPHELSKVSASFKLFYDKVKPHCDWFQK